MPKSAALKKAERTAANTTVLRVLDESTPATDRPDYRDNLAVRQQADVTTVRDVSQGTRHMRECGETYLPKFAQEDSDDYDRRKKKAVLFNAVKRTCEGLTGMIFRTDPALEADVPQELAQDWENIDLTGRHAAVFLKDVTKDAIYDGHTCVHVDMPATEGQFRSARQERAAGVRPYWIHVLKEDVMSVRWEVIAGQPTLTQVVYRESATKPVGVFGQTTAERYKVLRIGSFETWEKQEGAGGKDTFVLVDFGAVSLDYIPFFFLYTNRVGFAESVPPMIDLAYENIDHWQTRNEHKESLSRARIPMPFFAGFEDDVKWGPNYSIHTPNENAKASMLESSGAALDASRQDLLDCEARMAALGLAMLVRETRSAETAEAKRLDAGQEDSQLATFARGIGDGAEACLQATADYRNLEVTGGSVVMNADFRDVELSPQMVTAIEGWVKDGKLTLETAYRWIQQGRLPDDFDPEAEAEAVQEKAAEELANAVTAMRASAPQQEPGRGPPGTAGMPPEGQQAAA